MVKRFVSLGAAVCILFAFLCIPASAVPLNGTNQVTICKAKTVEQLYSGGSSAGQLDISYSQADFHQSLSSSAYTAYWLFGLDGLQGFANIDSISGTVVVTFSYFLYASGSYANFGTYGDATPVITFNRLSGTDLTGTGEFITFDPVTSYEYHSTGVTVTATFEGAEDDPITNPRIEWNPATLYGRMNKENIILFYVPSYRVIETSAPPADLAELQDIAKGIAESNRILGAMYGDILAVCNSIYERTGSILEAQQLTNQYFATVIPVINSINTNLSNIYGTLNTYFDLVLKAIDNQTVTLDQSIKDAEKALETYLKPMIDYFNQLEETTGESASTLPGHKSDLDGFASDSNGIDDDAVSGLASLLPVFSAFSFVFSVLGIFVGLGIFLLIIRKGLS